MDQLLKDEVQILSCAPKNDDARGLTLVQVLPNFVGVSTPFDKQAWNRVSHRISLGAFGLSQYIPYDAVLKKKQALPES